MKKIIIISGIVIVCCVALVTGVILLNKDKKESKFEDENETVVDNETTQINVEEYNEFSFTEVNAIMYTTSKLNVRNKPNAEGEVVDVLPKGAEVMVLRQCVETNWFEIEVEGKKGYVCNTYMSSIKPEKKGIDNSTEIKNQPNSSGDWITSLDLSNRCSQIIVVASKGNTATVSFHNKGADGVWSELFSTSGFIGRNGIGKTSEGDGKTPIGVFSFIRAFGNSPNPGCSLEYTQVDDSYYWVDDSNSAYYNQFVSTNDVMCDWSSAEHIQAVGSPYNYVLALDYNTSCTPGVGSAIFLHCSSGRPTSGCIAIPQDKMNKVMQNVSPDCVIVIDNENAIWNY